MVICILCPTVVAKLTHKLLPKKQTNKQKNPHIFGYLEVCEEAVRWHFWNYSHWM